MLEFQDLYETYCGDVYRFALWLSGEGDDAEDITSETFVRAWARGGKIRTETLKAYLFTIARNIYLEHQRKNRRRADLPDDHPDPANGPDRDAESRSDLRLVNGILQTLPEIDRSAFILRVRTELPYEEIARILGLSLSSAKVKVHRVRRKLITAFAGEEV